MSYNNVQDVSCYMIFNHKILHLSNKIIKNQYLCKLRKGGNEINGYRFNSTCSAAISNQWTQAAIDCYMLGCSCYRCNLNKIYFLESGFKCKMKETVIELVRRLGVPKEIEYEYKT